MESETITKESVKNFLQSDEFSAALTGVLIFLLAVSVWRLVKRYGSLQRKRVKLYLFYSDTCGPSVSFMPTWKQLRQLYSKDYYVNLVDVECKRNPSVCQQFNIRKYPTIAIRCEKTGRLTEFNGPRTIQALRQFVDAHSRR